MTSDRELRALHLALATKVADDALAATVAAAAEGASCRGARREAVQLGEHALRLTSTGSSERGDRLLALGSYLVDAGEPQRVTDLLEPEVETLRPGAPRVRAYMLLTHGMVSGNDEIQAFLARALAESGDEPALRAAVLADLAQIDAVIRVERIRGSGGESARGGRRRRRRRETRAPRSRLDTQPRGPADRGSLRALPGALGHDLVARPPLAAAD